MLLKEAIQKFRKHTQVTKSKGTQEYYKYYLNVLEKELGHINCDKIDNDTILDLIISRQKINKNVTNATINKYITTIKTVVKYATNRHVEFAKLRERKKVIPTVSRATYSKIFNHYKKNMSNRYNFRDYVFLRVLLDTGLRISEMKELVTKNIDFDTNTIYVEVTKTQVDRYVCITESTKKLLQKFIITFNIKGTLFFNFETKKKMTTSSIESFIYKLKKRLNITENITPHKWRHTFATNFLKNGGDLETLRLILGHSNLKTTQKYLHLSKQDIVNKYNHVIQDFID